MVRRFALRRKLPVTLAVAVAVVSLGLIVAVVVVPWLPAVGVVMAGLYGWDLRRSLVRFEQQGTQLAGLVLDSFRPGGSSTDRQRLITVLDRLAATFGVDGISAFIIDDGCYNAALVPNGSAYSFFVTSAVMSDFELIELEGMVAHCLARQRLGLLTRECVASVVSTSLENRKVLAGSGTAYRADEVAAAAIRYPLGLAGALRRCARQVTPKDSFFLTSPYAGWRWIWFNQWSDRPSSDLGDLDDVELRAMALEEW